MKKVNTAGDNFAPHFIAKINIVANHTLAQHLKHIGLQEGNYAYLCRAISLLYMV